MKTKRKGFAIVLVAALAGLIFLLGATLVAVSQLQTASANYDQRVRLAREHARAAMDMAVAELQQHLGKDTAVSFTSDVYREETEVDFKDAASPTLLEPFWTGAEDSGGPVWLTTRAMDGSTASPFLAHSGPEIELLGASSVGSIALLKVKVPLEPILVKGVDGYALDVAKPIGNYAYWVGDLGVKASYALYNKSPVTLHDEYGTLERRNRLAQLSLRQPRLETVDTNGASASAALSNPDRIDAFSNDFQFREAYGASSEPERFLLGLTEAEVEDSFHDFTPLSKGLLVDSAKGGIRKDLSPLDAVSNTDYDNDLLPYVKLAKAASPVSGSFGNEIYSMRAADADGPAIHPVLTQFHLGYSAYLVPRTSGPSGVNDFYLYFAAGFELWNPFSSAIEAEALRFEVKGLPTLRVDTTSVVLPNLAPQPVFKTPAAVDGAAYWLPGQIAGFSGPNTDNLLSAPYLLAPGTALAGNSSNGVVVDPGQTVTGAYPSGLPYSFDPLGDPVEISVELYLDSSDTLLATYVLPVRYTMVEKIDPVPFNDDPKPIFGFSWEISDDQLEGFAHYNPFDDELQAEALDSFEADAGVGVNVTPDFQLAETRLLGSDPTDDPLNDLSLLQLPKQELTSVAQLSGTYGENWDASRVGDPGHALNSLFDSHFFSTVGPAAGNWDRNKILPNSGYIPTVSATTADLQSVDAADELWVHGLFNVHSTSIESWAALLKGRPVNDMDPWHGDFVALELDGNAILDTPMFVLFNYPQGAEDRFVAGLQPEDLIDQKRASISQSMIAFSGADLDFLAKHIVSNIRQRVQGTGLFLSLEDFVNSGVLQDAIDDADLERGKDSVFKPIWVVPNSNREFRQSTILNLIAPYLSVRSDTFLVRAYGDAMDPGDTQKVWARAYCEAIVQRTHQIHDPSELSRRFEIVAFRWLSPSEI